MTKLAIVASNAKIENFKGMNTHVSTLFLLVERVGD